MIIGNGFILYDIVHQANSLLIESIELCKNSAHGINLDGIWIDMEKRFGKEDPDIHWKHMVLWEKSPGMWSHTKGKDRFKEVLCADFVERIGLFEKSAEQFSGIQFRNTCGVVAALDPDTIYALQDTPDPCTHDIEDENGEIWGDLLPCSDRVILYRRSMSAHEQISVLPLTRFDNVQHVVVDEDAFIEPLLVVQKSSHVFGFSLYNHQWLLQFHNFIALEET